MVHNIQIALFSFAEYNENMARIPEHLRPENPEEAFREKVVEVIENFEKKGGVLLPSRRGMIIEKSTPQKDEQQK